MRFKKIIVMIITAVSAASLPVDGAFAVSSDDSAVKSTQSFYEQWKQTYVVQDSYVSGEPQYYVYYGEEKYSGGQPVEVTVSEAHGYGMLITACLADYDSEAHELFDGMYRYYKAHPSSIGPNLMSWQQIDNGKAIVDASGSDSAADGDMDIAYSLLIADSVWGSDGEINYKQAAVDVINDIMTYEVNKTDWIIQLGDWAYGSKEGDEYYAATRASDFIMQYMPVFAEAADDERWLNVYESTYDIINSITADYDTGLLPDFIVKDSSGRFVPAKENFLEDVTDGMYAYNSCRTPWRISMDYLVNGNESAKAFSDKLNAWITKKTGGNPENILAGYKIDGTDYADYEDLCFTVPFLISAMTDEKYSDWKNSLWEYISDYGEDVYYGDTIKMLCMISYSGMWKVPGASDSDSKGDINNDGSVNIADLVLLNSHLLSRAPLSAEQGERADMNSDKIVDAFDSVFLRKAIING